MLVVLVWVIGVNLIGNIFHVDTTYSLLKKINIILTLLEKTDRILKWDKIWKDFINGDTLYLMRDLYKESSVFRVYQLESLINNNDFKTLKIEISSVIFFIY